MKLMRLAMCVAVFALIGGIALSEDLDVRALQAKLAAQEARLNDLQAKMDSAGKASPKQTEGVLSVRKNAVVTIGGQLNTRYRFVSGKTESKLTYDTGTVGASYTKRMDIKKGNLHISHARMTASFQANDYFDGFLQIDLQHDTARLDNVGGVAQKYWIRWKNLCNTGFGVLIGRNDLIYSDRQALGQYTNMLGGSDFIGQLRNDGIYSSTSGAVTAGSMAQGEGMFAGRERLMPAHTAWDHSRTLQINPYWESKDKKLRLDLSLFQGFDRKEGDTNLGQANSGFGADYAKYRGINYGLGSGTFRVMWKPISGLSLQGSVINFYQNFSRDGSNQVWVPGKEGRAAAFLADADRVSRNNTAVNFSVWYTPECFKRLTVYAKYQHGWNEAWMKDLDSDIIEAGVGFKLTEQISWFGTFDYFWSKNGHSDVTTWYKGNLWGVYTGFRYVLPYGVDVELGYRHDNASYKNRAGEKHTKGTVNTWYAHLGFRF